MKNTVSTFGHFIETAALFLSFAVPGTTVGMSNILSDKSFASLEAHVSEATMKGITEMGFTHMTDIQVYGSN